MDATKEFVYFQNHILNDEIPVFKVFQDDKGDLVAVNLYRKEDGELNLEIQINTISPRKFKYVGEFEVDGYSDFNWGMIEYILKNQKNSKKHKKLYKKAKKLSKGV